MVALTGGSLFLYGQKGETMSVIGGLMFALNFLNMLVLCVYSMVQLPSMCNTAALVVTASYLGYQGIKLIGLIVSLCVFGCLIRGRRVRTPEEIGREIAERRAER